MCAYDFAEINAEIDGSYMKRMIIKGSIVTAVFFATLFIVSSVMNKGNTDMTMEMSKASYPVIGVQYGGYRINEMHG